MNYQNITISQDLKVDISLWNSRIITVKPTALEYDVRNSEDRLIGINYNDVYKINEKSTITLKKQKYKIQYISKGIINNEEYYFLHTQFKISKSSTFLMPFLGFTKDYFKWDNGFVNCFVGIEGEKSYGDNIYLLYRFVSSTKYLEFDNQLITHPNFVKLIEPDPYHTMYCFNIPDNFKEDSEKILNGFYSTITLKAKERLLNFHRDKNQGPLYQILYKDPKRRKAMEEELSSETNSIKIPETNELYSPFIKNEEIYLTEYKING